MVNNFSNIAWRYIKLKNKFYTFFAKSYSQIKVRNKTTAGSIILNLLQT